MSERRILIFNGTLHLYLSMTTEIHRREWANWWSRDGEHHQRPLARTGSANDVHGCPLPRQYHAHELDTATFRGYLGYHSHQPEPFAPRQAETSPSCVTCRIPRDEEKSN